MAGIQSLPDELLAHLFSKLDRKSSRPDLLALRLVDKRCARLATDLIYLTIPGSEKSLLSVETHDSHPNIRRWAHKIFQNPECGPMVRELVYGRSNPMPVGMTFPEGEYEMSDELYDALRKIEPKLEAWIARLSNRDSHMFLLLTLALSPNLERFHTMRGLSGLGLVAFFFDQVAKKHIDAACGKGPPCSFLANVESIKIGPDHYDTGVVQILPLLALPKLELLEVYELHDQVNSSSNPPIPFDGIIRNHNPRLRLHFDRCELSETGLGQILQACKSPQALTIRWIVGKYVNGDRELHIERIAAALEQHGSQIEELVLDYTSPWTTAVAAVQHEQRTLGDMTRSKHAVLAVPYSNFAQILQDTPELDQAAAIAAGLPRELRKLYVLAVEGGLETPFGIESQQQTPFHELQDLMPTLESVVCVPWGYYDGRYVQKCVDYRAAKELELPMICDLDGIEPLERPTNGEKWKIRYQKPPTTVFDYFDMIA